jgi:hypothetical protein
MRIDQLVRNRAVETSLQNGNSQQDQQNQSDTNSLAVLRTPNVIQFSVDTTSTSDTESPQENNASIKSIQDLADPKERYFSLNKKTNSFHLLFKKADQSFRYPVDLIAVVDTSGSMQLDTYARDQNNKLENTGLSVLDVVKHALLTIVTGLCDEDTFGIVKFDSIAMTVHDPIKCTEAGKRILKQAIKNMQVGGKIFISKHINNIYIP